jgi:predicted GH43/DUF377 family glycosyl hydrolase
MPTWWQAAQDAAGQAYVVGGAYQKHWDMVVEDGVLVRSRLERSGIDSRWGQGDDSRVVRIGGGQLYGASFGAPRRLLVDVNGLDELCDSIGGEDVNLGIRLESAGAPIYYDRRMLTIESEELHRQGEPLLRVDPTAEPAAYMRKLGEFGVTRRAVEGRWDSSHMLLDIVYGTRSARALGNYYDLRDLTEATLLAVKDRFPQTFWFDGRPLADPTSLRIRRRRLVSRGDIPGSEGGVYNPGAVLAGPSIVLLCRREVDYRATAEVYPERILVDPDTLRVVGHRTLETGPYPAGCRIEDFRCLRFEGMLLVVHTLVGRDRIKPVLSRVVGDRLELFDDLELPVETARVEKNWVLFEKDRALHCLYKLDPLTVFVRTGPRRWRLVKEEENGWADQVDGALSNSTNLIPFMDGYLGFWHTVIERRYVQGAFLLGDDLDIEYRTGVLLDGAEVRDGKPGVLYVSSLVRHEGRVFAFYGEGDAHTSVAVFDGDELAGVLARSPFRRAEAIRVRYDGTSTEDLFRAMQALQAFSRRRGHPPIRLYVTDVGLRHGVRLFKIPNLAVREQRRHGHYDYAVNGPVDLASLARS